MGSEGVLAWDLVSVLRLIVLMLKKVEASTRMARFIPKTYFQGM